MLSVQHLFVGTKTNVSPAAALTRKPSVVPVAMRPIVRFQVAEARTNVSLVSAVMETRAPPFVKPTTTALHPDAATRKAV